MFIVQINPVPNQIVTEVLFNQSTKINLYQLSTGLYCDVMVDGTQIIGGVVCLNRHLIVRNSYLGFNGDLAFVDMQGPTYNTMVGEDPYYTGLSTQFQLIYLSPYDLWYLGVQE